MSPKKKLTRYQSKGQVMEKPQTKSRTDFGMTASEAEAWDKKRRGQESNVRKANQKNSVKNIVKDGMRTTGKQMSDSYNSTISSMRKNLPETLGGNPGNKKTGGPIKKTGGSVKKKK